MVASRIVKVTVYVVALMRAVKSNDRHGVCLYGLQTGVEFAVL